jgi:hypothetical protein
MSLSPELQSKMVIWRSKCNDRTITEAELTEAMAALREERKSAATAQKTRTAKAKAAIPTAEDLLKEIDGELGL